MVTTPADIAWNTPVEETVPTEGLLLLHVPPAVPFDNVIVCPTHTTLEPVMAVGDDNTVTVVTAKQPPESV